IGSCRGAQPHDGTCSSAVRPYCLRSKTWGSLRPHVHLCNNAIHVTKVGDRFAALEPISQRVREQFGSVEADAGRGLSLRMDHGSQYTADDFRAQIKFWGMTPSYAFVAEPQTNGIAERFNRAMKEPAIHGRLFKNAEEVRAAAVAFKNRYNREWRLEKLGFKSPLEARQAALLPLAA
ncbi:MAG: integrase core domain-containing protein, partial [Burkholderia sp.]